MKHAEIFLEAQIIAVADVVESMMSHRTYWPGLGIGAALEEISLKRDSCFDTDIVDACLKIFLEQGFMPSV